MKKAIRTAMTAAVVFTLLMFSGIAWADQSESLKKLLPDLPGWQAEQADGASMAMNGFTMVNAARNYASGDKTLDMTIVVGSNAMMQGQVQTVNIQTDDMSISTAVQDGFNVVHSYDKKGKTGSVVVNLLNKEPNGGMFSASYANMTPDAAMALVKKFDWNKMKQAAAAILK